jgi:hypothetical protein
MFKRQKAKPIENHLTRASDKSHSDSHDELELTEATNMVPCLFYGQLGLMLNQIFLFAAQFILFHPKLNFTRLRSIDNSLVN